uniref:HTH psq-type domain-containing protein n=1 Tax=Latimeria chalumnae TaxID=7897 RepID=H3B4U6_LATCH
LAKCSHIIMDKPRKELSLKDKVTLIKSHESTGKSQCKLAEDFGIGKTQVCEILKTKAELMTAFEENENMDRKRINLFKEDGHNKINNTVWCWFKTAHGINAPISGPLIQEVALKYAKDFNI